MYGLIDGSTDGRTVGWMDGWMDGWVDREWKLDINHTIYVPLKTSTTLLTFFNSSSFFDLKKMYH